MGYFKGKHPFSGKINAKLLFAGNTLPAFDKTDGTAAVVERMHFIKATPHSSQNVKNMI